MKIRINNIFVNKKTNDKQVDKIKDTKEEMESKRKKIRYRNFTLKKIYDSKNFNNSENIKDGKLKRSNIVESVNKDKQNSTKRRRKGYTSLKVIDSSGKEKKINIYYNNLMRNKNKLKKGYYVLLIAMIALSIGSVKLVIKTYNMFNNEDYEVFNSIDETSEIVETSNITEDVELQDINTSNKDTITELEESKVNKVNNVKNDSSNNSVQSVIRVAPLNFSKPVEGEILKPYSIDKVIYSKTLELWKTHDGIDIKVDEGTYIKSIERGTIEKVYEDSFYGVTVVIDHGQGYKSSYSNLDKETLVKEKQSIIKGQKIGKVGKTAIGEIKDESHIHFMLFKDGQNTDPTSIFK